MKQTTAASPTNQMTVKCTKRRQMHWMKPTSILIALQLLLLHPASSFAPHRRSPVANQLFTSSKHWIPTLASSQASNEPNHPTNALNSSFSAIRSTLRTATGLSLTTLRATLRAATGISLSRQLNSIVSTITGLLPAGVRYFLQPLLILYYAPQLILRYYMVGPSNSYVEESRRGHERVVEGWRRAVEAAEKANEGGYWPVHLNEDGSITASLPPNPDDILDVTEGIEKSVELEQELSRKS